MALTLLILGDRVLLYNFYTMRSFAKGSDALLSQIFEKLGALKSIINSKKDVRRQEKAIAS